MRVEIQRGRMEQELVAASEDGDVQLVNELIADGADVNYVNAGDGSTALMVSAEVGHTQVVAVLLAANADANLSGDIGSEVGWTPLMVRRTTCD